MFIGLQSPGWRDKPDTGGVGRHGRGKRKRHGAFVKASRLSLTPHAVRWPAGSGAVGPPWDGAAGGGPQPAHRRLPVQLQTSQPAGGADKARRYRQRAHRTRDTAARRATTEPLTPAGERRPPTERGTDGTAPHTGPAQRQRYNTYVHPPLG